MVKEENEAKLIDKWGEGGLCLGWTALPSSLMFLQAQLGLTSTDLNVLLNLMIHWWDAKDRIYPSQDSIAYRMGVSKRTVQRTLDRLVDLELIEVKHTKRNGKYGGRNLYSLTPLSRIIEINAPMVKEAFISSKEFKENE
ncbi:helix-turn-helix domain-containing protein [Halomonas colorata]|uniref:Helix-turn-helix domain-containing protein n=1 Tax=Halomonas colorata TaxID=2742615 RepID=A0ABR9G3S7_9GAMM|nr:helix-turn-helix domain-containing protein [Halomonas colorata]MBE0465570.1 helix-turn-helix domain-containing protein [Halomonas colorata]